MTFGSQDGRYSYDRRRFVEIGMTVEAGDVWSFKQMAEQVQRPVDGADPALQHALRVLARDHGREFKNLRKVGYLRLDDEAIVGEAENDRERGPPQDQACVHAFGQHSAVGRAGRPAQARGRRRTARS